MRLYVNAGRDREGVRGGHKDHKRKKKRGEGEKKTLKRRGWRGEKD